MFNLNFTFIINQIIFLFDSQKNIGLNKRLIKNFEKILNINHEYKLILPSIFSTNDFILPYKKDFQNPATAEMFGIINLHNHIMFIVIFIVIFVLTMIYYVSNYFTFDNNFTFLEKGNMKVIKTYNIKFRHHSLLEFIWTVIPTLILLSIVIPSFALLYSFELFDMGFDFVIKATGHQWYWSYEITIKPNYFIDPDNMLANDPYRFKVVSIDFDSYMIPTDELQENQIRLLATTEPLLIPSNSKIKLLVTSDDVLHSWAVPAFGCKMDACPGRLNQVFLSVKIEGVYYGQCSELCGVNHGFMPIEVRVVSHEDFYMWLSIKDETGDLAISNNIKAYINNMGSYDITGSFDYNYWAKETIYIYEGLTVAESLEKAGILTYLEDKKEFFKIIAKDERDNCPCWITRYKNFRYDIYSYRRDNIFPEPYTSIFWMQTYIVKLLVIEAAKGKYPFFANLLTYLYPNEKYISSIKLLNDVRGKFIEDWYKK